jgi:hypothetical protein
MTDALTPLYAVRLREPNRVRGFLMRSYTSASGSKYTAGTEASPSPLRMVSDPRELAELREIPQFEILTAPNEQALRDRLQTEMEARARVGGSAVRAAIVDQPAPDAVTAEERLPVPKTALETVLTPTQIGEDDDADALAVQVAARRPTVPPPARASADEDEPGPVKPTRSGGRRARAPKSA